jgi:hypothetical protein
MRESREEEKVGRGDASTHLETRHGPFYPSANDFSSPLDRAI